MQSDSLSPLSLPISTAALLLSNAFGEKITEQMIKEDIQLGAPMNADGTINLIHYAAWLVNEVGNHARHSATTTKPIM